MAGAIMQALAEMVRETAREHLGARYDEEFGAPNAVVGQTLRIRMPADCQPPEDTVPGGIAINTPPPADRSIELLKQWLTPRQRADFEDFGCFDVIGNETGLRYRITDDSIYNIHAGDRKVCVVPYIDYQVAPLGDRMLAQKIALETDEGNALAKANIVSRLQKYPAAG